MNALIAEKLFRYPTPHVVQPGENGNTRPSDLFTMTLPSLLGAHIAKPPSGSLETLDGVRTPFL
jgi:hypothetical protein